MTGNQADPKLSFNARDGIWVDLVEEAFMGDVVACLGISRSLQVDLNGSETLVRTPFAI